MLFRRTTCRYMKPYLHLFSPGRTAAEKGSLYRNSNQNAHARLANMNACQRTIHEDRRFKYLMIPEQSFYAVVLVSFAVVGVILSYRTLPMSAQSHREKWLQGGVSTHERYVRRDEMGLIFAEHQQAIENTQALVQPPAVLSPPVSFTRSATA